jgi:hypothetical protein
LKRKLEKKTLKNYKILEKEAKKLKRLKLAPKDDSLEKKLQLNGLTTDQI